IDPAQVQLRERRARPPIHSLMLDPGLPDDDTLNELAVQRRLDQAFAINAGSLRSYLHAALGEVRPIHTRALPIQDARDLLSASHLTELAGADHAAHGLKGRLEPSAAPPQADV